MGTMTHRHSRSHHTLQCTWWWCVNASLTVINLQQSDTRMHFCLATTGIGPTCIATQTSQGNYLSVISFNDIPWRMVEEWQATLIKAGLSSEEANLHLLLTLSWTMHKFIHPYSVCMRCLYARPTIQRKYIITGTNRKMNDAVNTDWS